MTRHVRVLLLDDSIVFREKLLNDISLESHIHSLISAKDPIEALYKIEKYRPDVIICNIELLMGYGLSYIRQCITDQSIPVIAIGSRRELRQSIIRAGAVGFVSRPSIATEAEVTTHVRLLLKLAVYYSRTKQVNEVHSSKQSSNKVIAIGATKGKTETISSLLSALPSNCPPVLVAHHAPLGDTKMFVDRLKYDCSMSIKQAEHGDLLRPGFVLVAPASQHMMLTYKEGRYIVQCVDATNDNDNERALEPSLDALFQSVADTMKQAAIGVLLNSCDDQDGMKGLLQMKKAGAITFTQHESDDGSYTTICGATSKVNSLDHAAKEILLAL